MKKTLSILLLTITAIAGAQQIPITVSGIVKDPFSQKGIPGIYVAFVGTYATGFMGGTEYRRDLVLDSTDAQGHFRLYILPSRIDSFARKEGGPVSVFHFALDVRTGRSGEFWTLYHNYQILVNAFHIDTFNNLSDRNYINQRILLLTEKNQRLKADTSGMVINLYRGSALRLHVTGTEYIDKYALHVIVREPSKYKGKPETKDEMFLDKTALEKPLLLAPNTPVDVYLSKWERATGKDQPLQVIRQLSLPPESVKDITL
jgi:hypothetical protein